ncbi:putative C6 finger domain protein Acr-2 [Aspergillus ambiguus]|uniref:Zn(II)2Cys6 transcription factor n=1 Tax=Aspergillus ambiguus TaxID=176160 RepID=UPI003CCD5988
MTKGCYTCRRRRIICDNGLPTCRKCRDAGKECLGYQKPLVWVKGGVASRGKMMGRSFDDVKQQDSGQSTGHQPVQTQPDGLVPAGSDTAPPIQTHPEDSQPEDHSTGAMIQSSIPSVDYVPSPRPLIDPLFKDLSPLSRFYIIHFNENLVNYLALYSSVQNPFRDLTLLVGDSPVLAHALAATGALHYAILANSDFSPMPWSTDGTALTGSLLSSHDVEQAVVSTISQRPASKVYEHFLAFKHRALHQLSRDVGDSVMRNDTRTLAAIMVLALMDAIESGDGAWKYHLEGAKKILKIRERENNPTQANGMIDWLDTFAVDGCLLIQLMGSTLARPGSLSKPFYSSDMGTEVLKRLEQTSWVGCPAYLLEVIFVVHAGWCSDSDSDPTAAPQQPAMNFSSIFLPEGSNPLESPLDLLQHIQAFDPISWAEEMQSFYYLPDVSMRVALATVYRAAVYLYASRVLSRPRSGTARSVGLGLPADHTRVTDLLIREISLIPLADPHFKCLIWPTFIAGAECRDPAQRPFLLRTLSDLYYDVTSVNVRNAAWVLSLMWQKRDAKRQAAGGPVDSPGLSSPSVASDYDCDDDDFDWIQELDNSRVDWLFI